MYQNLLSKSSNTIEIVSARGNDSTRETDFYRALVTKEGPLILLTYYIDLFDSETVGQLGQRGIKWLARSVCKLVLVCFM